MGYSKAKREEWAGMVFEYIPSGPNDAPIGAKRLAALSELTGEQVRYAVEYLRDNMPDLPLLSSPEGYIFSIEPDRNTLYGKTRAKYALTVMQRTWRGAMKPYLKQAGINNPAAKLATKQFERVIEDLAEIVS